MQLELSRYVEGNLDDIADFIAHDNPVRAVTFIRDIRTKLSDIRLNPMIYQPRPDIGCEARMATVGNNAIVGEVVRNERVIYGARDLPGFLDL